MKDINFLKDIICLVEINSAKEMIEKFYSEYTQKTQNDYMKAIKESEMLYESLNLNYDAKLNPFIS